MNITIISSLDPIPATIPMGDQMGVFIALSQRWMGVVIQRKAVRAIGETISSKRARKKITLGPAYSIDLKDSLLLAYRQFEEQDFMRKQEEAQLELLQGEDSYILYVASIRG